MDEFYDRKITRELAMNREHVQYERKLLQEFLKWGSIYTTEFDFASPPLSNCGDCEERLPIIETEAIDELVDQFLQFLQSQAGDNHA